MALVDTRPYPSICDLYYFSPQEFFRINNGTMIQQKGPFTLLTPPERLDTTSAPEVEKIIVSEIDQGASLVLIDFSTTSFVSSAGLRVVLKVAKLLRQQNGSFALFGLNDQIAEVFEVSGFNSLVTVCKTFEEAAEALKASN